MLVECYVLSFMFTQSLEYDIDIHNYPYYTLDSTSSLLALAFYYAGRFGGSFITFKAEYKKMSTVFVLFVSFIILWVASFVLTLLMFVFYTSTDTALNCAALLFLGINIEFTSQHLTILHICLNRKGLPHLIEYMQHLIACIVLFFT